MKPPPFEYFCPTTVSEAVELLATQSNPKILAGGQSLMAMLNLRYLLPDALVDINHIPELAGISIASGKARIGAMTRQRVIERDAALHRVAPILPEALRFVGHRQTRNRGTIGGSLCHLDPAAELASVALLYDAEIEIVGRKEARRTLPIAKFIGGFMTPNIEAHEIVAAVSFPLWKPGHGYAFHEFARRHGDFCLASASCLLERNTDNAIARIAIAVGGLGPIPQRLAAAERLAIGTRGEPDVIERAVDSCSELEAIGDFHGSASYRLSVAQAMLRRCLKLALARAAASESAA
jgi:carbon-monoxide dehydrogenase medium subunit